MGKLTQRYGSVAGMRCIASGTGCAEHVCLSTARHDCLGRGAVGRTGRKIDAVVVDMLDDSIHGSGREACYSDLEGAATTRVLCRQQLLTGVLDEHRSGEMPGRADAPSSGQKRESRVHRSAAGPGQQVQRAARGDERRDGIHAERVDGERHLRTVGRPSDTALTWANVVPLIAAGAVYTPDPVTEATSASNVSGAGPGAPSQPTRSCSESPAATSVR